MLFSAFHQDRNLDWFPRLRAMSLAAEESEGEQVELRNLQTTLETTQKLVSNLTQQLFELREQVRRFGFFSILSFATIRRCIHLWIQVWQYVRVIDPKFLCLYLNPESHWWLWKTRKISTNSIF